MAKWHEIIKSKKYQDLDITAKAISKKRFFNTTVKSHSFYKKASLVTQKEIENKFYKIQDGTDPISVVKHFAKRAVKTDPIVKVLKKGDVAVEKVADFIAGDVTATGNPWIEFPRLLTGEIARFAKPTNLITARILGTALKPIGKAIGKVGGKIIPQKVKDLFLRKFTVGKGTPEAFQELTRKAKLARGAGSRESEAVAKALSTKPSGQPISREQQRFVGRIFRKEVIESPALKANPKYQELKVISDSGRKIMDKWSKELVKTGIPSKEATKTIENNVDQYMARMYEKHFTKTGRGFGTKELRLRLDGLKHRKNLSESVRKSMGEIKEPALPTAVRVKEISTTVANNKLFGSVAKNPEWASNTQLSQNMIKMGNSKNLGALRNKWVVKPIADEINGIISVKAQNLSLEIYSKGLSAWKYGKVVLNPATHARNMISNSMLLDLSGVNHIRQATLMPRVMRDYLSKGRLYKLAVKHGAIGDEFIGGDVAKIKVAYETMGGKGNISRFMNAVKLPFRKAGDIYQAEEQISKMIKFTDMLSKGARPDVAAKEAQKWLFNYNEIPDFIKAAKHFAPFITFTYKALPRVGEAIVNNPLKVYKYFAMFKGWNEASRKFQKQSPTEFARETNALPPWLMRSIGGVPMTLMMPWRDKHGRSQWLNLEYILPLGMAPEAIKRPLDIVSNPLFTLYADLSKNKDFKGQDIVPVGSTKAEALRIAGAYAWRQIMPSFTPSIFKLTGKDKGEELVKGGYSFQKIIDALRKNPDYAGRTRELPQVLFDTLIGIKLTPVDVDESEQFSMINKRNLLNDLRKQALRLNSPAVSDRQRDKGLEKLFQKMQKVIEQ